MLDVPLRTIYRWRSRHDGPRGYRIGRHVRYRVDDIERWLEGLRVEDVDFLGRQLPVRQQVKLLRGQPMLAPPKGRKTRDVPLPDVVALALAERLREYPAVDGLVFTSREHKLVNRTCFNRHVWKPARRAAGVAPVHANGMHALRHFYASAILDAGTSIRAVADYLGHQDPRFTLRTYTHLMPSSEDRVRQAIDAVLDDAARGLTAA